MKIVKTHHVDRDTLQSVVEATPNFCAIILGREDHAHIKAIFTANPRMSKNIRRLVVAQPNDDRFAELLRLLRSVGDKVHELHIIGDQQLLDAYPDSLLTH